jgi:hypothetical protein
MEVDKLRKETACGAIHGQSRTEDGRHWEEGVMFGTVGRAHVKPENREKLVEVLKEQSTTSVRGFRNAT